MRLSKPAVILKPSPNFDHRSERRISAIVLHDTGSNNCCGDLVRMRDPASGIGAHYLVGRDGCIYQLVAEKDRVWPMVHNLPGNLLEDLGECALCIAIVHDSAEQLPYPEAQREALDRLVRYLADKYAIPPERQLYFEQGHVRKWSDQRSAPKVDTAPARRIVLKPGREAPRVLQLMAAGAR